MSRVRSDCRPPAAGKTTASCGRFVWVGIAGLFPMGMVAGAHAQDAPPVAEVPAPQNPAIQSGPGVLDRSLVFDPSLFQGDRSLFEPLSPGLAGLAAPLPNFSDSFPRFSPGAKGLHFYIDEAVRYSDNVRLIPNNRPLGFGQSRADAWSTTSFGANFRTDIGRQSFFITANYGLTRYRWNTDLNSDRYFISSGLDLALGDRCRGRASVGLNQSETSVVEQVTVLLPSADVTRSQFADASMRCKVWQNFSVVADAAWRNSVNLSTTQAANDYDQYTAGAGIEYEVPRLHTIGVKATYTARDFQNRAVLNLPLVASETSQLEYKAYYRRTISPKTSFSVSAGIIDLDVTAPGLLVTQRSSRTSTPSYNASLFWRPTPKVNVVLSSVRSVGAPQNLTSDFQIADVQSILVSYAYSPKVTLSAVVSRADLQNPIVAANQLIGAARGTIVNSASVDLSYRLSSYLDGSLGYRYASQTKDTLLFGSDKAASSTYLVSLKARR